MRNILSNYHIIALEVKGNSRCSMHDGRQEDRLYEEGLIG